MSGDEWQTLLRDKRLYRIIQYGHKPGYEVYFWCGKYTGWRSQWWVDQGEIVPEGEEWKHAETQNDEDA